MIRSMYTAATGMEAQQLYMDAISHNLSNVNTNGFKRSKMEFHDLMYQTLREPGVRNPEGEMAPAGIEVGLGVRPAATHRIFEQGSVNRTDNPLDVAISGEGFFQVELPDGGIAYTRDGQFKLSSDGTMVTSSGYRWFPDINIPSDAESVSISPDGLVEATLAPRSEGEPSETVELGQVELVRFVNPAGLKGLGGNLFAETEASGAPIIRLPGEEGAGTLMQGFVEASNVQIVEEMVNMITAQRAFEIVSKSIQVSEEMMQTANNLKR
ncbi:MAG: flagellar basal-body rod protein FlgG [Chitinivibrionales bacterium]|nr:flagellar basal-body rod protein FlgG [Chitinivibrionales bacterium]MBD3395990.1 flagellar basal-body rod protein FlgG [Chitinivibrionales bacterium]